MDLSAQMPMLFAELNAAAAADLVFWTQDELYRYADLALSDLSGRLLLFVDAQDLAGVSGQPTYDLAHTTDDTPVDTLFVSLLHLIWNGTFVPPANVREVEALDANWRATTGTVSKWIGDDLAPGMIVVYPAPTSSPTFTVFCQRSGPTIAAATPSTPAPDALADWLHMKALVEARRKRSDAWMPEAATLAEQVAGILEQAFAAYYGEGL